MSPPSSHGKSSRRKGKAMKLERRTCSWTSPECTRPDDEDSPTESRSSPSSRSDGSSSSVGGSPRPPRHTTLNEVQAGKPMPEYKPLSPESPAKPSNRGPAGAKEDEHFCKYCDMSFKEVLMYTLHMGYHGYQNPFKCNMCGQETHNKVDFFIHIARSSHK